MTSRTRTRTLVVTLVLGLIGWSVDSLLRGSTRPRTAQAASAPPASSAAAPAARTPAPAPTALGGRLYESVAAQIAQNQRDLFSPTERIAELLSPPNAEPPPELAADEAALEPAPAAFADRHMLTGVVLGTAPLAVVDGLVMGVGEVLDGCRLTRIERDYVEFVDVEAGDAHRLFIPGPDLEGASRSTPESPADPQPPIPTLSLPWSLPGLR